MAKRRRRKTESAETVERFVNGSPVRMKKELLRPDNERMKVSALTALLSRAYRLAYNVETKIDVPKLRYQYNYNGFAAGIVNVTLLKTWKTDPLIMDEQEHRTSDFEEFMNRRLREVNFWRLLQEADRMAMIADHSYLILKIADGKDPSMPVSSLFAKGALESIVDFIPVWANSLKPFYNKDNSKTISHYQYDMGGELIDVHPDRVITVSKTGRDGVAGLLRTNYHQLVGLDLMMRAAPEARRKNAAHNIAVLFHENDGPAVDEEDDGEIDLAAKSMMEGNQSVFAVDGVKDVKVLNAPIAPLDQDFQPMVQALCAGALMGFRNLIGNEQGQLASEEDTDIFLENIEARRRVEIDPIIMEILRRLKKWDCIPKDVEFAPKWEPLNPKVTKEASEKVRNWAEINRILYEMGEIPAVDVNEMRVGLGHLPRSEEEIAKLKSEYEGKVGLLEQEMQVMNRNQPKESANER